MNAEEFEKTFWNYYLELEREYLEIERTIPFDETNYDTFSYKYMDLLWAICSEIDVLFKEYMEIKDYVPDLDEDGKPIYNIKQYAKFIDSEVQNFKSQEITCYNPRFHKKKLFFFFSWRIDKTPKWLRIINKLKHSKDIFWEGKLPYRWANQICVLNALAALFQINLYIYKELKRGSDERLKVPLFESELFQLEDWGDYYRYIVNGRDTSNILDDLIKELINHGESD